jgi:hypothetical protein
VVGVYLAPVQPAATRAFFFAFLERFSRALASGIFHNALHAGCIHTNRLGVYV